MRPLDTYIKEQLNEHTINIGKILNADVMAIFSPIFPGLEVRVRDAIEKFTKPQKKICIILDTTGGVAEVVERMVYTIRHHYNEVIFIIPNVAMSAGTIFVMSGDRILMDSFSCLGPIDPQIEKDENLIPALSYLYQFERLNEKSSKGELTSAEYALLSKLDLGELYQFEQAKELSRELLVKWLSIYKFKDWKKTETKKKDVTKKMKEDRANEIAEVLCDNSKWHSHGRSINMSTLINEINLKIEDYTKVQELGKEVREYFDLLRDYMNREKLISFVHSKEFF
ncbi:MAG: serine dehydrogenasease [Colwellia sp.]|nr:serine dehydrogenasease [Colwellia sp.]